METSGESDVSRSARARSRAAERAGAGPEANGASDLQSILASAVQRLARRTGTDHVAAWSLRDGTPFVVAATTARPRTPTVAEFAELAAWSCAGRLDVANATETVRAIVSRHGLVAAAPVGREPEAPACVVLLVGASGPGEPRPRVLAQLSSVARAIAPRVAAAIATSRVERLDTQMRHLDRLAALGELVSEIVHEVRNPLVSLKTFLQLLPERIDEVEFRTGFFELVNGELRRIERLLDVVLSHARPRVLPADGNAVEVAAVIDGVTRLVAHRALERGIEIETTPGPAPLRLRLGEDALRQVLLNLVLNAIEATPAGGRIGVDARTTSGGVELWIDDEGPGLPGEIRQRIFEPFFSTRDERPGGLGLAISRRIVEEAGGQIEPEDRAEGGTRFRVMLPTD